MYVLDSPPPLNAVSMRLRIAVILAVRNEAALLKVLMPILAGQGLDIVIIDNDSTDDTEAVVRDNPLLAYQRLPFPGYFSLGQQLEAKKRVIGSLDHDWIVHQDGDEVLQHADPGRSLRDAITEADTSGFNTLNFNEFCFLAEPDMDYVGRDYVTEMRRYYHFRPFPNRLHRAWKRTADLDNTHSLGHKVKGREVKIAPQDHVLRHYIALSQDQVLAKYQHRVFDAAELEKGFHWNRVGLTPESLKLPKASPLLSHTEPGSTGPLRTDPSAKKHFWQWSEVDRG